VQQPGVLNNWHGRGRVDAGVAVGLPTPVYDGSLAQRVAVLDTPFWSSGVPVGIDACLPSFFARPLLVPNAVVEEMERKAAT
jgi:hypothetical protein